jgi:hypothetical protein
MSCFCYQVSQSAEVVSSAGKGEQPTNLVNPSQLHFPQHPPKLVKLGFYRIWFSFLKITRPIRQRLGMRGQFIANKG